MKMQLRDLTLTCRRETVVVRFSDFSYFFGEIGAGKSTIARLVDYCLGGSIVLTPALQNEFVSARLALRVSDVPVVLQRDRDSDQVLSTWGEGDQEQSARVPARRAQGIVIPGTKVENLSDFVFHLAGISPPRVRRSRINDDSDLERLSLRDLLWYCYLDQDEIDSSFFNLDAEADAPRRNKSRNVMRFLLGIHQQDLVSLEIELDQVRSQRLGAESAAAVLETSLRTSGFASPDDLDRRRREVQAGLAAAKRALTSARLEADSKKTHASDVLRRQGADLAQELDAVVSAMSQVTATIATDKRHLHEVQNLDTKLARLSTASAVLGSVQFTHCPKCAQALPDREQSACRVCGLPEPDTSVDAPAVQIAHADIEARVRELKEMVSSQEAQLERIRVRHAELMERKQKIDLELNQQLRSYDSAYLSLATTHERRLGALEEELTSIGRTRTLHDQIASSRKLAVSLVEKEADIRKRMASLRAKAEADLRSLKRLGDLFKDCLLRARIPGFAAEDVVRLRPSDFLPEILPLDGGDVAVSSFATLGSGGKKTLFKACFAVAVHRLAAESAAPLPSLLIIDSPMKNISERENREQFVGFHEMLYWLADGELRDTQFVLIDKEFCPPKTPLGRPLSSRHMTVVDPQTPPLIPGYRDRPSEPGLGGPATPAGRDA
ncbi:MAG: hypothetical protein IT460_05110 [Planctomycetes bacterium]|nr:hypothetical protein [Planctomycetota bacterium]